MKKKTKGKKKENAVVCIRDYNYKPLNQLQQNCGRRRLLSQSTLQQSKLVKEQMDPLLWHKVAAMSGVAALGLGTYGSHVFKPNNPTYKEVWNTASLYHLVHTAALVAAPITKRPNVFGGLLTAGIIAFSGTCYTVAFLEDRKYATFAPYGGFAFIAAWASLLF